MISNQEQNGHFAELIKFHKKPYLIVFGGRGPNTIVFNDLWLFDIKGMFGKKSKWTNKDHLQKAVMVLQHS